MLIRLTITQGKDAGQVRRFRLAAGEHVVLGRHEDCDLPLWDEAASRRHALLELNGERVHLIDLGSSNGTLVNGQRIDRHQLTSGDRIAIGETEIKLETEGFHRRETVVLTNQRFTVESSLSADEVDLGAGLASDDSGRARLKILLDLVTELQACDAGDAINTHLITCAYRALDAQRAAIVPCASRSRQPLWNESLSEPKTSASTPISRSIVESVLSENKALRISDAQSDPMTRTRDSIVTRGVVSIVAVPITARDHIHGVLCLEARGRVVYSEQDLAYVAVLAQIAGMALKSAEKLQQSRRLLKQRSTVAAQSILTHSPVLQESLEHLARFAASGGPVLIVGETGSGKELLAQHAHENGAFKDGPLIPLNCAAIPSTLLESELFGHEKGAFTGATNRKAGMFELAHGGTLFLDEIGDMPLDLQPKLLRVLETGEFFRIGGRSSVAVRLLVVSATHRDLEERVRAGDFREDLFFRLNRFRVEAAPLRQRPEDIVLLAEHFLDRVARRLDRDLDFSEASRRTLLDYTWPGNVRELLNVVERAAVVAAGSTIQPSDLSLLGARRRPDSTGAEFAQSDADPPPSLEVVEERAIRATLRYTDGKKGEAAQLLGIAWPTLRRKLKKYAIDANQP